MTVTLGVDNFSRRRAYWPGMARAYRAVGPVVAWRDPSPYAPMACCADDLPVGARSPRRPWSEARTSSGGRAVRTLRLDMNFLMGTAIVAAILVGAAEAAIAAFLGLIAELLERFGPVDALAARGDGPARAHAGTGGLAA
ncbi:MAG: hypothetical protein R2909_22430 [Gemmatimonadales bacterium]